MIIIRKTRYRSHPSTCYTACKNAWKTHHIRQHVQYCTVFLMMNKRCSKH